MSQDHSNQKPKFDVGIVADRFRTAEKWADEAFDFACKLDWLGNAKQHPEGSEHRDLALVRDKVDNALNRFGRRFDAIRRVRTEATHCTNMLVDVAVQRRGDASDALHLMRRYDALRGDEGDANGDPPSETFPDSFVGDTYLRVSALPELAEQFPKHIRHSARDMHGWPMIVSHHLDCTHEFQRIAELLELGADYPLAAGPRKRRGTETPLLHHLEPLVWRLHVLRSVLIKTEQTRGNEKFEGRLYWLWWQFPEKPPKPEIVAILKTVPHLPGLTQKTAGEWSGKAIVPIILIEDAADRETCKIPALRNTWRHKSVKSVAIFRSRLHSAVQDTLRRFARSD